MHAERLNSIASETVADFEAAGIVKLLDALVASVQRRLESPSEPSYDQQISDNAKALFGALDKMAVGEFPPTWRKIMAEMHVEVLLPETLRADIEKAFAQRLVDSDLVTSLKSLRENVVSRLASLKQLRDAFSVVGIPRDDLEPEEVEFDVAMPRESISDNLGGFNKEIGKLNKELLVLSEIAATPPPMLRINSISTNDFTVAINVNVDLGEILACILLALKLMRVSYRTKLDVLGHESLKDLPKDLLDGMKAWVNAYVRDEIAKITAKLPDICPKAVDRAKLEAQSGPVRAAIEYIEEKQERGFNMDVRVGEASAEDAVNAEQDGAQVQALEELRSRLRAISEKSAELKVLERQLKPILSLSESDEDDDGKAGEAPNDPPG